MITNSSLTIYHKNGLDVATRTEKWRRFNYDNVWFFGGKGAGIRKGYQDANDVEIRIWYELNEELDINNFAIGDIKPTVRTITSSNNNDFGINQHIHIGGK